MMLFNVLLSLLQRYLYLEIKNNQHNLKINCKCVLDPAEVNLFHLSKQTVLENDTYAISCKIDGNPSPLWTLMNKDSGKILIVGANASNFTLSDIKAFCEDSGFWECTGFNVFNNGVNATRGANLTVHCMYILNYLLNYI